MKKSTKIILGVVAGVIIIGAVGSTSTTTSNAGSNETINVSDNQVKNTAVPTVVPTPEPTPEIPKYELVESELLEPDIIGTQYIVGKIKNNSGSDSKSLCVTFDLYDEDGAKFGQATDYIDSLEADGLWKFKAMIWDDADSQQITYKLVSIK